jgi:hypothetical protein
VEKDNEHVRRAAAAMDEIIREIDGYLPRYLSPKPQSYQPVTPRFLECGTLAGLVL